MANELVLRIITDSKGNRVSLDSIPIEAADVLTVFLESLSDLAKAQENTDGIRISLHNSSVGIALEFPEADTAINSGIDDVLDGRSPNNQYYKTLKTIQDRVKANGLSYEIVYKVNNVARDLTEDFKSKDFVRRVPRRSKSEEVVFIKGIIYQAGGKKNANLHLTVGEEDITINCTQDQAKRLERVLYTELRICALKTIKSGEISSYSLLDSYSTEETYQLYKTFYASIDNDSLERFDLIVDRIVEAVERPKLRGEIVKLLRLFDYPQADRGNLRTILVALKSVRQEEPIAELYTRLADHLRAGSTNKAI